MLAFVFVSVCLMAASLSRFPWGGKMEAETKVEMEEGKGKVREGSVPRRLK